MKRSGSGSPLDDETRSQLTSIGQKAAEDAGEWETRRKELRASIVAGSSAEELLSVMYVKVDAIVEALNTLVLEVRKKVL